MSCHAIRAYSPPAHTTNFSHFAKMQREKLSHRAGNSPEALGWLKEKISALLAPDEEIFQIMYRNVDMGVFGKAGYAVSIRRGDRVHGVYLGHGPSDEDIERGVRFLQGMVAPR